MRVCNSRSCFILSLSAALRYGMIDDEGDDCCESVVVVIDDVVDDVEVEVGCVVVVIDVVDNVTDVVNGTDVDEDKTEPSAEITRGDLRADVSVLWSAFL